MSDGLEEYDEYDLEDSERASFHMYEEEVGGMTREQVIEALKLHYPENFV